MNAGLFQAQKKSVCTNRLTNILKTLRDISIKIHLIKNNFKKQIVNIFLNLNLVNNYLVSLIKKRYIYKKWAFHKNIIAVYFTDIKIYQ